MVTWRTRKQTLSRLIGKEKNKPWRKMEQRMEEKGNVLPANFQILSPPTNLDLSISHDRVLYRLFQRAPDLRSTASSYTSRTTLLLLQPRDYEAFSRPTPGATRQRVLGKTRDISHTERPARRTLYQPTRRIMSRLVGPLIAASASLTRR